jgi:hypothetical protein
MNPTVYHNLFSATDLDHLVTLPEVTSALETLNQVAYFSIPVNDAIRNALQTAFGLAVPPEVAEIPMRWIRGDLPAHTDHGASEFDTTYLVYLTDSSGTLVVGSGDDSSSVSIEANMAVSFSEGLLHYTENTGDQARLLIGPMNEFFQPVGVFRSNDIYYYSNYMDALNYGDSLGRGNTTLGEFAEIYGDVSNVQWRVASAFDNMGQTTTTGLDGVFSNGTNLIDVFPAFVAFNVYPSVVCFKEGTKVLASINGGAETYLPIERLRPGDLVRTSENVMRHIDAIGKGKIGNVYTPERMENRLYVCTPEKYPELAEPLYITGCHSILVDAVTPEQRADLIKRQGKLYITAGKYRLIACVDKRAEPWIPGTDSKNMETVWHLSLGPKQLTSATSTIKEAHDPHINYGIYVNGSADKRGLLVETCFTNRLLNMSGFEMVK